MKSWTTKQLLAVIGGAAVIAIAVGASLRNPPPGSDITLPNSPLYNIAVTESVNGLKDNKKENEAKPCPDCGKIHEARAPDVAQSAGGVSQQFEYCVNCKVYHRKQVEVQIGDTAP